MKREVLKNNKKKTVKITIREYDINLLSANKPQFCKKHVKALDIGGWLEAKITQN